jgi:hypothetical protein
MLPVSAQLKAAGATIYTVSPPAARAIIKMVRAANVSASDRTFNVYVDTGGGSRQFSGKDQSLPVGYVAIDCDEFELAAGHSIVASCSVDDTVEMIISGREMAANGVMLP